LSPTLDFKKFRHITSTTAGVLLAQCFDAVGFAAGRTSGL